MHSTRRIERWTAFWLGAAVVGALWNVSNYAQDLPPYGPGPAAVAQPSSIHGDPDCYNMRGELVAVGPCHIEIHADGTSDVYSDAVDRGESFLPFYLDVLTGKRPAPVDRCSQPQTPAELLLPCDTEGR